MCHHLDGTFPCSPKLYCYSIEYGTNIIVKEEQKSAFRFEKGPIFANLVLADEINRATPKTQSALLEAMQEHTVTIGTTAVGPQRSRFWCLPHKIRSKRGNFCKLPEAQLSHFFCFAPFRFTPFLPVVVPTSGHVQCIWVKGVYFHSKGCQPGAVGKRLNSRKDS